MSNKLSTLQQRLYDSLTGGGDVAISKLYKACYPDAVPFESNRFMQQKLGPCIARTNAKLTDEVIKPGWKRRSYTLGRKRTA